MLSFSLCVLICAGYTICCTIENDRIRRNLYKEYLRKSERDLVFRMNDIGFIKEFSERIEIESDGSESAEDFVMYVLKEMIKERQIEDRRIRSRLQRKTGGRS